MKKMLLFMLAVCLLCMAGCTSESTTAPTTQAGEHESVADTVVPEETVETTQEETTEEPTLPPVPGIEGTTMYNEEKFAFVITGLEPSAKGWVMSATAVNKTDMTVFMRLMNLSVNGFMFETLPTVTLKPAQTKETTYTFTAQELDYNGIEDITDLQFNLWVYETEDFQTPDVADGLCRYYPQGKAAAVTYERESLPTDRVLVDNERYTVTVTAVTVEKSITLELHLKNKSGKELLFITPYVTVDGAVLDPAWACNVSAGKQRNAMITLTAKALKAEGVKDPMVLELPIQIGDHSEWSNSAYLYEVFTIALVEEPVEEFAEATVPETT